ncbi:hypothetical protein CBM2585_B80059 [Cupriavidus taiwanensis]|nr:hypothetical protein CBM2585_B80059 [Cupriavidus taiwanensis]
MGAGLRTCRSLPWSALVDAMSVWQALIVWHLKKQSKSNLSRLSLPLRQHHGTPPLHARQRDPTCGN